jgi:subtilisin family serine protease
VDRQVTGARSPRRLAVVAVLVLAALAWPASPAAAADPVTIGVPGGPGGALVPPDVGAGRLVGRDPASSVVGRAARRVVLTLAPGVSPAEATSALAADGLEVVARIDPIRTLVVDAGSAEGRAAAVDRLAYDPRFAAAEPSSVLHATGVPNDPMLSTEWWLDAMDVRPWWDWPAPATPVTIAIVDTGVDLTNADLAPVLLPGKNFITPAMQPQDDGVNGHGTHVAGIAAASTNDGIGMAGVAAGARILPVKVLDATENGEDGVVAQGIVWATDQGARVINLSMEGAPDEPCPRAMTDAIAYARSKEVIVVAASGNQSSAVACPARIPGVLSVGAVDKNGQIWSRSNRGPQLSLVAPGVAITSTLPTGMGGYGVLTGTSMATPMVSGAAAIVAAAAPSLGEAAIRGALTSTAKDLGLAGRDDLYGAGIVDVGRALAATAEPVTGVSVSPAVIAADGSGAADSSTLAFAVVVPVVGTVTVEAADGTLVRTLDGGPLAVGERTLAWDGRDDAGTRVADGDYRFAIRGMAPGGIPIEILRSVAVSAALVSARATPSAISPNGDGRADRTTAAYVLRAAATVTVAVSDAAGRTVRTLASGPRTAGSASVSWDGRRSAAAGSPLVADGTYAIVVSATTASGTWAIAVPVIVSIRGVAVTGVAASPVFPFVDGYRDRAAITYTQAGTATATVYVYPSTSTKALRALPQGRRAKGKVTASWDGRDAAGRVVAAGTYRVRVRTVDAGGVVRWSSYAPVTVSAKRLYSAVWTATLRGDARDPRSFTTSADLTSIGPSTTFAGGIRMRSDSPDERAVAFWAFAHPAWTVVRDVHVSLDTARSGTGDAAVGTWNGSEVDAVGWVSDAGGVASFEFPAAAVTPAAPSFFVAVEQAGPGSIDVGSVTVRVSYATLR